MSESEQEHRRDEHGRVWRLLRPPFRNWREQDVVQATTGWEQGGAVRRDLHVALETWLSWKVVDAADAPKPPVAAGSLLPDADLYELAHQALVAVEAAGDAITAAAEQQEPLNANVEPLDPWLLYVLCDELSTCLEQLSFPVEALGERAAELAETWENEATLLEPDEARPMVVQLERAAGALRRAHHLAVGAAVATMQPALRGLVEDLEVRLRIPDSDPPRWVDVVQGWGETGYRVRDARADGPPLHERPLQQVQNPAALAATIAQAAGISIDSAQGERIAADLAHEASRRLEAMASQRDRAFRHWPSDRLPEDPEPERVLGRRAAPEVLTAALEDLADRDGARDTEPLGLGLAMALAAAADSHPDSLAGLLAHPGEDSRASELVRALVALGRATLNEPQCTDD